MGRKRKIREKPHPLEYDFHGMTAAEATRSLLDILDNHEGKRGIEINIIHGKGSGVLAGEVERIARSDPRIESFHQGFFNQGVTTLVLSGGKRKTATVLPDSWDEVPTPPVRRRKR